MSEPALETLTDRLRYALQKTGKSQAKLSREAGVSQQSINYLCSTRGKRHKRSGYTVEIAAALGVRHEWLANGEGPMWPEGHEGHEGSAVTPITKPGRVVPVLTWEQASTPQASIQAINAGLASAETRTTFQEVGKFAFFLTVQGDAMHGPGTYTFPEGTELLVDPSRATDVGHGSFVIVLVQPHPTPMFRQLEQEGDFKRLKPLNPRYPIIDFGPNDEIVGKVVEYRQSLP